MNLSDLKSVFLKEMLELSRSLGMLSILLLVCAAYPTGLLGLANGVHMADGSAAAPLKVAVDGDANLVSDLFKRNNIEVTAVPAGENAEAQVVAKQLDAVVTVAPGINDEKRTGSPASITVQTRIGQNGLLASTRLDAVLERLRHDLLRQRLNASHLTLPWFTNVNSIRLNQQCSRAGKYVIVTLPFLLTTIVTLMCASSSVDSVNGERTRKTWQPLLVSALDRNALLYGKLLSTVVVAMFGVVVCIGSLLACSAYAVQNGFGDSIRFAFPEACITILFALPLAAFLSALFFLLCACARSTQEAGLFTTAATIVLTFMPFAAAVPQKFIAPALYMMPVVNAAICTSEALQQGVSLPHLVTTVVSSCLVAAVFLYGCSRVLKSESLLWNIQIPVEFKREYIGTAVSLLTAAFLLFFYCGQLLMAANSFWGTIATQVLLLAGPALYAVWRSRLPVAQTMSIKRVPWFVVLGGALLAPGTAAIAMAISVAQTSILPTPEQYEKILKDFVLESRPLWQTVLAMAITPGICEELLFRGAVFGFLRKTVRPVNACLITGALFGLFHLSSFRFLPSAALGVVLCLVTLATGSILPAMALHATHNCCAILMALHEDHLEWWYLAPAAASTLCGLLLISLHLRRRQSSN